MVDCINSKYVKIRKNHACHGCSCIIEKNTIGVLFETFINSDGIYNLYFCKNCQDYLKKCQNCRDCYDFEQATEGYIKECKENMR